MTVSSAYDTLPDGVVICDADGRVAMVNPAAERLLRQPVSELLGKPARDALPLRDLSGGHWWDCLAPYGGLRTRSRLAECSWYLPDGTELLVTGSLVRDVPRGPVIRVELILRAARARERSDRMRSDLVATVAHDLRSPLTGVKGFTSTLLAKWNRFTDEQRQLMLRSVDADADRLTQLIAELLDVARIDSGRLTLRRHPVDLAGLTRQLLPSFPLSEGRTLRLEVADAPMVWLDPDKFWQVLTNLLENAERHGDGQITVGIGPSDPAADEGAQLYVEDDGTGVPEDLRDRVFGKYWRRGSHTGTGLGLYIVHGLVNAHGGTVEVETGRNGGALFRVTFPIGEPAALDG